MDRATYWLGWLQLCTMALYMTFRKIFPMSVHLLCLDQSLGA
jgi:hypothetical protein